MAYRFLIPRLGQTLSPASQGLAEISAAVAAPLTGGLSLVIPDSYDPSTGSWETPIGISTGASGPLAVGGSLNTVANDLYTGNYTDLLGSNGSPPTPQPSWWSQYGLYVFAAAAAFLYFRPDKAFR